MVNVVMFNKESKSSNYWTLKNGRSPTDSDHNAMSDECEKSCNTR